MPEIVGGRYFGRDGVEALELRVDLGPAEPAPACRVSGDWFRAAGGGGFTRLASFFAGAVAPDPGDGTLEAAVETPDSPGWAGGALRLAATAAAGRLRLELALRPAAGGAAEALTVEVERLGAALRAVRLHPWVEPGAEPPDSPNLDPVAAPAGPVAQPAGAVTVASAFADAGVDLAILDAEPLPAAAAGLDDRWTDAEIHAALAARATAAPDPLPGDPWALPLLVVSRSSGQPLAVGVTFDTGDPRIGRVSALFYGALRVHPKLTDGPSFARELLFTACHELGHLLGLPHAWEPFGGVGEPERGRRALTFMTYPHLFQFGYSRFYREFRFAFRPEERLHLRHGAWPRIFPRPGAVGAGDEDEGGVGGDGGEAEPRFLLAPREEETDPRLTLELKPPAEAPAARFRFAEPVHLEVRVANVSPRRVKVPGDLLDPEGGRLTLFIEREAGPRRRWSPQVRWQPAVERDRVVGRRVLGVEGLRGEPSYALYGTVALAYGRRGFPFAAPGRYRVTASAALEDGRRLTSAPLAVAVAPPEPGAEGAAGGLFTAEVGSALAFGGDPDGRALGRLEEVVRSRRPAGLIPWAALRLGEARSRPFRRPGRGAASPADPAAAARWLLGALDEAARLRMALPNPLRSRVLALGAECAAHAGDRQGATSAVRELERFIGRTVERNRRLRARLLAGVRRLAERIDDAREE